MRLLTVERSIVVVAAAFAIATVFVTPTPAVAQTAPDDAAFSSLGDKLREGDTVTVTGSGVGRLTGKFVDLTPESLLVSADGGVREIPVRDIDKVSRRRKGVLLGTFVGFVVGVACAVPLYQLNAAESNSAASGAVMVGALSTLIGWGIDRGINLPRTVYQRKPDHRVQIAPHIGPKTGGVALHVSF